MVKPSEILNGLQVRVAGRYVTVLLDPNSYDAILNDTSSLDFTGYKHLLMERIFSLKLPTHNTDTERVWMKQYVGWTSNKLVQSAFGLVILQEDYTLVLQYTTIFLVRMCPNMRGKFIVPYLTKGSFPLG